MVQSIDDVSDVFAHITVYIIRFLNDFIANRLKADVLTTTSICKECNEIRSFVEVK